MGQTVYKGSWVQGPKQVARAQLTIEKGAQSSVRLLPPTALCSWLPSVQLLRTCWAWMRRACARP